MTADELMFFDRMPEMAPVYAALREKLRSAYPDMEIRVAKTQISFRNRHLFAMASLPARRVRGWPERYLLVSFGLSHRQESPRIVQSVEPYPNRWTHHVIVTHEAELDDELMGWIEEAYRFALAKARGAGAHVP